MSIVNFLVYKTQDQKQTETELDKLGYAKVTKRTDHECYFWHLNECIILVKEDPAYTGFTGLGLVCSQELISTIDVQFEL